MSRIAQRFSQFRALIPFVTAGDPEPAASVPLMHAMVAAGADLIELGVPFSDPMADGPVIQRASERALDKGVSLHDTLKMVRRFRSEDDETPVVLMGYLNPIEVMGYGIFAAEADAAGVDGVLTVDLPPEEAHELVKALREHGLDPIFLLAPTSTPERMRRICAAASGFVYYVSLKGVTGSTRLDVAAVAEKLGGIREVTDLPIGVGFGIRDADSAARVATVSDAVVVGSALVSCIEGLLDAPERIQPEVTTLVSQMRQAIDAATKAG
jgi:tryptophan synthase alpha chain